VAAVGGTELTFDQIHDGWLLCEWVRTERRPLLHFVPRPGKIADEDESRRVSRFARPFLRSEVYAGGLFIDDTVVADVFSKEKRSQVMACVKGRDTKPERLVRSLLHRLGYRFTVNGPKNRQLPGKTDIVLPKYGAAIFVHGCFWHGHEGCRYARLPKSRTDWWRQKIERNRVRDLENIAKLEASGWNVVVLWTCEFNRAAKLEAFADALPNRIKSQEAINPLPMAAESKGRYGSGDGRR